MKEEDINHWLFPDERESRAALDRLMDKMQEAARVVTIRPDPYRTIAELRARLAVEKGDT